MKIDGVLLAEDEGRALWQRFSAYMEANRGDLAGFAKSEGLASIHPAMEGGRAILVGSRSAAEPQRAYASVTPRSGVDPAPLSKSPTNSAASRRKRR